MIRGRAANGGTARSCLRNHIMDDKTKQAIDKNLKETKEKWEKKEVKMDEDGKKINESIDKANKIAGS
jgi:ppGpp synthetase/RelA/SpoT-type nucleotidyltranferase